MAFKITGRLVGSRKLKRELKRRGRAAPKALGRALFRKGERIMSESKRIVPVAFGALKASGHVQLPVITGKRVIVVLGYGGAAAPYAVFVHERQARHTPPTQWKYLEKPFNEALVGMARRLADDVKPAVAKGRAGGGGPRRDPRTGRFV